MLPEGFRRKLMTVVPVVLLFSLLLISLYMMNAATQNSQQFSELYALLLIVNILEVLVLGGLIVYNLLRLVRQYRNKATGSRLATRLVVIFVLMSTVPTSVLYYFSLDFIRRGVDTWFDTRIDQALDDALNLSRTALDWRMRDMLRQTHNMADELADRPQQDWVLSLDQLRHHSNALEVGVFYLDGQPQAFVSEDAGRLMPQGIDSSILSQLKNGIEYVGLDPSVEEPFGFSARLVVLMPAMGIEHTPTVLQAIYAVPERIETLGESVQHSYAQYEQMQFMRGPMKTSFTFTLSMVLLLSLFTAIWAAFYFAQRLVAPIRVLAIGTRAVASGDYHRRLPQSVAGNDELGFLVKSFNTMTERIASAQRQADRSRLVVENQKQYLEAVLSHLSSGVITFDQDQVLRTANASADQILGLELSTSLGQNLVALEEQNEILHKLVQALRPHLQEAEPGWQEQVELFGQEGRKVLMCRGVALAGGQNLDGGHVIVFDDITALLQAQRDAAWGEVARRLAHEIKNPLTPIQLAAERMRHRYLGKLDEEEGALLDRSTHTIVQQVEAMKKMVQAFSDYARSPKLDIRATKLNNLITEILDLYRADQRAHIIADLDTSIQEVDIDCGRMRQLLHNLIRNALAACEDQDAAKVQIVSQLNDDGERQTVEISVCDNGIGIADDVLEQLFEPYFTTKPKGGGLGLAIVKKIIEEHNGVIWVERPESGGACFKLRLPLRAENSDNKHDKNDKNRGLLKP